MWTDYVGIVTKDTLRGYSQLKYSAICLPVRVSGNWLLIICDLQNRRFTRLVFDEWDHTGKVEVDAFEELA